MKNIFFCALVFIGFYSCGSGEQNAEPAAERQAMIDSITSLQKQMFNQQTMEVNAGIAQKEIELYRNFVQKYPGDSLNPEFLFRASDLTVNALHDSLGSVQILKQVCKDYPDFRRIPECLFLQGYYYQDKDSGQAKIYYRKLIEKYPDHPFTDDAKALLQMFGKSEQDIINSFEKKAGGKKQG